MSVFLKSAFKSIPELNFEITSEMIKDLESFVVYFETKNEHSLTLNSAIYGVHPIYFLNTDAQILFQIFGVTEDHVQLVLNEIPDSIISSDWYVLNDTYNQLTVWLAHRILNSKLTKEEKDKGLLSLFKMLNYKFFTSFVNHCYRYGANKAIMEATINSLSNKFDIIKYGTWKKVLEVRSLDIIDPVGIHYKTLLDYDDDLSIKYVLSDSQTRIRNKLKLINEEYAKRKEENDAIGTYASTNVNSEGEKFIIDNVNVLDTMISNMLVQVQSTAKFIDNEAIKFISTIFKAIHPDTFRRILVMYSDLACVQANSGDQEKIGKIKSTGEDIYIGVSVMISTFLQKTYRACILDKIDITNKKDVLVKARNLYTSSRVNDPDILMIKRSFSSFVVGCGESTRTATISSLTIGLMIYLLLLSFNYV